MVVAAPRGDVLAFRISSAFRLCCAPADLIDITIRWQRRPNRVALTVFRLASHMW